MKKVLSLLMAIVTLCTLTVGIDFSASAEEIESGELKYIILENGTAEITGYSEEGLMGDDPNLIIPSAIDGYTVTSIGEKAFDNISLVTDVVIPNSVIIIKSMAFGYCQDLKRVTIGNGVAEICSRVFTNCENLYKVDFGNSVKTIGENAFYDCPITYLDIPDSVERIEDSAFWSCSFYVTKSMTLGAGLQYIDKMNFKDKRNLTDVYFAGSKEQWDALVDWEYLIMLGTYGDFYVSEDVNVHYDCAKCTHESTVKETHNALEPTCRVNGYTGDVFCTTCGRIAEKGTIIPTTSHAVIIDKAVAPTCTDTGMTEGKHCSVCNKILVEKEIIPATGHNFGNNNPYCANCGEANPSYAAPAEPTTKPVQTTMPTTKPTGTTKPTTKPTERPTNPQTTQPVTEAPTQAPTQPVNVQPTTQAPPVTQVPTQQPTVPVTEPTAQSTAATTKKTTVKKPKTAAIKKLKKAKKSFKVYWKKLSGVKGYQIQYSTSKKFSKKTTKTVTVKGNKTTSKTIKKLKGGKKYYVRVRAFNKAKVNGKTKTAYGSWSKVKIVTVKK